MGKLRLIQCGVGGFGAAWVQYFTTRSPDFELVALVDVVPRNLELAAPRAALPAERCFATLQEAIAAVPADAVLTVTPPPVHVQHARLAFAAGLHLMTEKPLADSMEHALEMTRLARESGRQLVVSQQYRYNACVQTLKHVLAQQCVGELGHGTMEYYFCPDFTGTFRETMEYPFLLDMAIHHFDLIRCVTGRNVVSVQALSFRPAWSWFQHHTALKMFLELEGGIPFSYSADWSARGHNTSGNGTWRLQCEAGSLIMQEDVVQVGRCQRWNKEPETEVVSVPPLDRPTQAITLGSFAAAIVSGRPAQTNGEDNLHSLAVVMAAQKSVAEGRRVFLHEVLLSSVTGRKKVT